MSVVYVDVFLKCLLCFRVLIDCGGFFVFVV